MAISKSFKYKVSDRIAGRYQIFDIIKTGGMSEVYCCYDLDFDGTGRGVPVVLKTIRSGHAGYPDGKTRLESELSHWIALENHPNIVKCHGLQVADEQIFLILSYIHDRQGQPRSLRDLLFEGPLDLRTAIEYGIDVCSALVHAGKKSPGMVHADLKPENLLVCFDHLKVTDFGLSKVVTATDRTAPRAGTPRYMAPEQWLGREMDSRTDIYAVGCVLYEMLYGKMLADSHEPSEIRKIHLEVPVERLVVPDRRVPSEVPEIVVRCVAKNPGDRFESTGALLAALWKVYKTILPEGPEKVQMAGLPDVFIEMPRVFANETYGDKLFNPFKSEQVPSSRFWRLKSDTAAEEFSLDEYLKRGHSLFDGRQWASAYNDYDSAMRLAPDDPKPYFNRGRTALRLHRREEGLIDFEKASALTPDDILLHKALAGECFEHGLHHAELGFLSRLIALQPEIADNYFARAGAYRELGMHEEALADYGQAIAKSPADCRNFVNRGHLRLMRKQFSEAIGDFEKALELGDTGLAHVNLGSAYVHLRQLQKAYDHLMQARSRGIDSDELWAIFIQIVRGVLQLLLQVETEDEMKQKLAGLPMLSEPEFLGQLIFFSKVRQESEYSTLDGKFRMLLGALEPAASVVAYYHCGHLLLEEENYEEGLEALNRSLELDSAYEPACSRKVAVLRLLGRYEEALDCCNRAIETQPEDGKLFSLRGLLYHESLLRFDEALKDHRRAVELAPAEVITNFNLGSYFTVTGRLEEAFHYFDKAGQLGSAEGAANAAAVRRSMSNPFQQAVSAFITANSLEETKKIVDSFPVLRDRRALERIQTDIEEQTKANPALKQWLQQKYDFLSSLAVQSER